MMSSDSDDTNGMIITPITMPAVSTELAEMSRPMELPKSRRNGPKAIKANRP
jgi:hypothetical protein